MKISYSYIELSKDEINIFNKINMDSTWEYKSFILVLLKELDYNINKLLKILNLGTMEPRVFPKNLYRKTLILIKKSIIINDFLRDKNLSIKKLVDSSRYKCLDIGKTLVNQTIREYNLKPIKKYNKVK